MMKRILSAFALCLLFAAVPTWAKSDAPTEATGSFAYNDSTETRARTITAAFDFTMPVTDIFSLGLASSYSKIRLAETETESAPAYVPPDDLATEPPDPGVTSSSTSGGSLEVWSAGVRAALFTDKSHNGVYFAAEAVIPQHDAEGYLLTPEVGFQFSLGGALARIAYKHPFHQSAGELLDLESQSISFGFGGRF
jgi:hypothetical protein